MRDHPSPPPSSRHPPGWDDAFAGLPAESPPADGWARLSAALDARERTDDDGRRPRHARRPAAWLAMAAVLALAVVVPWRVPDAPPRDGSAQGGRAGDASTAARGAPGAASTLQSLHAESARLEALLAHARDGRVATGNAATLASELESRLAAIDAALAEPGLTPAREQLLWAERVHALRALAGFEGTRRWLAANGEQYDGTLVQVN